MDITHIKYLENKKWMLVFHHDIHEKKNYFSKNEDEFLYSNTKEKFSILGYLDDSFRIRGNFEFLLEYPDVEGFNMWTQTVNPLKTQPNQSNGYKPGKISFPRYSWNGLARSTSNASFLDGDPTSSNWFYAIGQKEEWVNSAIPGPYDLANEPYSKDIEKYGTFEVKLWIRIDKPFTFNILFPFTHFHLTFLFVLGFQS